MDIYQGLSVQYDNQYVTLYTKQYQLQGEFCSRLLAARQYQSAQDFVDRFVSVIANLGQQNKFIYIVKSPDSDTFYSWYTGFKDSYTSSVQTYVKIGDYVYNNCPVITGPAYEFAYWTQSDGLVSDETTQTTLTVPYAMTEVFNPAIIEVFKAFGVYESSFESDVKDLLESIACSSETNYTNALNTINQNITDQTDTLHTDINDMTNTLEGTNEKIDETNDKLDDVQNTLQDTNDFLQSTDVDDDNYDLPTEDTQDITQDGINNIFTIIQDAFLGTPTSINITFPFTNKTFSIPYYYVETELLYHTSTRGRVIVNFIRAFYWYLISRFIVLDIAKKIKKIKSGNLENIQNDNIKEDML